MSKLFEYYGDKVKKGEFIFKEGDNAELVYMIHKGKVQITKDVKNIKEKVQILKEGEFFGEMAVIDSLPRSANAMALEDCELIKMDRESFEKTIKENHQFAVSVIRGLSERLRDTNEIKAVLAVRDRTRKFIIELLTEYLRNGKKDGRGEWYLIKKDLFLNQLKQKNSWEESILQDVLNDVFSQNIISIKKDQGGTEWIAYKY